MGKINKYGLTQQQIIVGNCIAFVVGFSFVVFSIFVFENLIQKINNKKMDSLDTYKRTSFESFQMSSFDDECNLNLNDASMSGNLKGSISIGKNVVKNIYISTIRDNVTYFLTTMPAFQGITGTDGNMGLAFIPVKVDSSMKVSDISDKNTFGKLYNVPGTMTQRFNISNTGTSLLPNFHFGYANNAYLNRNKIFSLGTQITRVLTENNQSTSIPMSIFKILNPIHNVHFTLESKFNLNPGDLYAGVKYSISFSGESFFIPFFPPVKSTLNNGISRKIDSFALKYPDDFSSSSGIDVYLINLLLYETSNCGEIITSDPRDILNMNLRGSLTKLIFTNVPDCIVGINYKYCPPDITCTGNCKSSCPIGTCEYNASVSKFECEIPIIPVIPVDPISEGIMFWIILLFIFVIILVIIGSVVYSYRKSNNPEPNKQNKIKQA